MYFQVENRKSLGLLKWILYTSSFAALCAVGLCMATEKLLLGVPPNLFNTLHIFVAANTMIIYNFHYYIKSLPKGVSDRADWSQKRKHIHLSLIILAALISAICTLYLKFSVIAISICLGLLSLAYSLPILPFPQKKRLKDWGILKLILLSLVWASVTVLMPMFYWGKHFQDYEIEFLMRFCFMLPLCAAFDIRDMKTDQEQKIFTLPNAIGLKNTYRLMDLFLIIFGLFAIWQYFRYFIEARLISNIIIIILSRLVISYSKKATTDIFYLLCIDGMMLVYAMFILFI